MTREEFEKKLDKQLRQTLESGYGMLDAKILLDEYIDFLKKNIKIKQLEKGYEITTPFLDEKNDCIQLYVSEINGDDICLSDGGDCLAYWEELGIELTSKRSAQLSEILRTFGVYLSADNCLNVKCNIKDFARKKHALLQAIIKVNDLASFAQTRKSVDFSGEVTRYFDRNDVTYMRNMSIVGKTGFVHTYDFSLAKTKSFNERFCKLINRINKSSVVSTLFGWRETQEQRNVPCELVVFANTVGDSDNCIKALNEYNVDTILMSDIGKANCNRHFLSA